MSGHKASVDRDGKNAYDLINPFTGQTKPVPDAERETAYHDQEKISGTEKHADPYKNGDEVYNGFEKDTSRIADKKSEDKKSLQKEDKLTDLLEAGHMKKLAGGSRHGKVYKKTRKYQEEETESNEELVEMQGIEQGTKSAINSKIGDVRFRTANPTHTRITQALHLNRNRQTGSLLRRGATATQARRRARLEEGENPQVASAPATSDSPMLGMYAFNTSNSGKSKYDIRAVLESIALQAAEAFEAYDENSSIPDAFGSELDQCSKAITRLHSYLTQDDNNFPMSGSVPIPNEPPKPPIRNEEVEPELEEEKELSPKQKKIASLSHPHDEIDSGDLAKLRAKAKMEEAAFGIFKHLLRNEK